MAAMTDPAPRDREDPAALETLRASLARAEETLQTTRRTVSEIVHEMNNPLQTIRNYTFLAENEFAPGTAGRTYLETITAAVKRIADLAAQLREVYRGPASPAMQPVDLCALLEEVHGLLEPDLHAQRVEWILAGPRTEALTEGCPDELRQVFHILGRQVLEALRPNGGTMFVEIAASTDGKRLGVTFRDTGPGLAPEQVSLLLATSRSPDRGGFGSALALCGEIVRQHRGEITVAREPGQGAALTVWLPSTRAGS